MGFLDKPDKEMFLLNLSFKINIMYLQTINCFLIINFKSKTIPRKNPNIKRKCPP